MSNDSAEHEHDFLHAYNTSRKALSTLNEWGKDVDDCLENLYFVMVGSKLRSSDIYKKYASGELDGRIMLFVSMAMMLKKDMLRVVYGVVE